MGKLYGYCRISTRNQSIERQVRNILRVYPEAIIIKEIYTGTSFDRPEWNKLMRTIQVMMESYLMRYLVWGRNAAEGFDIYKDMFERGINLIYLKESHINTESYRNRAKCVLTWKFSPGILMRMNWSIRL